MIDFKELANKAITVEVGGGPVTLGWPSPQVRHDIQGMVRDNDDVFSALQENPGDRGALIRMGMLWSELTPMALAATVRSQELSVEEWGVVQHAAREEGVEGFDTLVDEAMRLCGLSSGRRGDGEDGVVDHTDETLGVLGDSPS